jgi:tripartite-type tricarboxylate transporter receptor subunit TctC
MTKIKRRTFIKSAAAAGFAAGSGMLARPAFAQGAGDFPNKPIKFIVPLAPGGAIDFIARAVGERMQHNGHNVVVENRTGAGGTIGMDTAMKSPPDGYTVLITNDNAASAPHIMSLSYDYTKELVPVCYLGRHGQILAAHSSLGVNSVKELVDYVKKNPGLGLATSGVGSNQHVLCEWFKRETGAKFDHVPYRGAGQAINDLIAAHVKVAMLGPTSLMPHAAAGTVKLLAQSMAKRAPTLPNVPTLDESGYKGLILEAWYAAFVPKGTPAPIVAKLNAEMNKALQDSKLKETFTKGAIEPVGGGTEEISKLAQADSVKYAKLVKELNIKTSTN